MENESKRIERLDKRAKASREATLRAAEFNQSSFPSRTYARRFQFMEAQFAIEKSMPKLDRKERRKLAREVVKANRQRMKKGE
jgi:hypothetical protein